MRFAAIWVVLISAMSLRADQVDFDRDIRPILSENCSFCHGPDANRREADLRLDTQEDAMTVIEPGDREASELFARIATDDPDALMPPPDSNRELTNKQIELIGRWIDEGATWSKHWAFRPLVRPEVPGQPAFASAPVRNPIDAFVQQVLQKRGMRPAPQADRRTLVRRLSLDLRGLSPTIDEVEQFLADTQPGAYERLVKRMLDSPAYGQRMAWNWLDAARYADSNGYQGDRERTMWPWRDWVVDAFNRNLPYDQFTVWQLAGDLLPDATDEQMLATGFCRNHMINGEGGRIAEENRVEYVMDMTETTGTVWLGLTLNCCRCHDHKYDPITNQEYYQLFGFFNQTPVTGGGGDPQNAPNMPVPDEGQQARLASVAAEIKDVDSQLAALAKSLVPQQAAWEQQTAQELARSTIWTTVKPKTAFATRQRLRVLDDDSVLASGPNPDKDTYTVTLPSPLTPISGLRLEALKHHTMTAGGLARSNSGNFVLTAVELSLVDAKDQRTPIKIASAEATFEQGGFKITGTFDNDPKSGWAVHEGRKVDREHAALFVFDKAIDVPDAAVIEVVLRHDSVHQNHNLGRFRLSLTGAAKPELTTANDTLITDLNTPLDQRTDEQKKRIGKEHRESHPEYKKLKNRRDTLVKMRSEVEKSIPRVMIMQDMAKPRRTFILTRGLYNKPAGPVSAGLPEYLPQPADLDDGTPLNRLTLARWLVDDQNPLTARVTVNRFWQQILGVGLVKTPEDFGRQGEIPIQMDLLNWLAAEFRDSGWDVKQLMRTIVTSHTYRQSSRILSPQHHQADPDNRLLSRGARYRMPSWMLRDQAIAASGLLSSVDRGPAVNTYQPDGVWEEASFGKKTYRRDSGEKLYRRSLYTFWRRIIAPTMFFDNASRQTCTVKEGRTNTPLHALQTLNNTAYVEAARALAQLALQSQASADKARIDFVLQRVLARPATATEQEVFASGLNRTRSQFQASPEDAAKLVSIGESPRDESIDAVEHASWTALCLAVLNLDETLNRE